MTLRVVIAVAINITRTSVDAKASDAITLVTRVARARGLARPSIRTQGVLPITASIVEQTLVLWLALCPVSTVAQVALTHASPRGSRITLSVLAATTVILLADLDGSTIITCNLPTTPAFALGTGWSLKALLPG